MISFASYGSAATGMLVSKYEPLHTYIYPCSPFIYLFQTRSHGSRPPNLFFLPSQKIPFPPPYVCGYVPFCVFYLCLAYFYSLLDNSADCKTLQFCISLVPAIVQDFPLSWQQSVGYSGRKTHSSDSTVKRRTNM